MAEERMNLIKIADFSSVLISRIFAYPAYGFSLYHRSIFSISQFSLHNKIILFPKIFFYWIHTLAAAHRKNCNKLVWNKPTMEIIVKSIAHSRTHKITLKLRRHLCFPQLNPVFFLNINLNSMVFFQVTARKLELNLCVNPDLKKTFHSLK